MECDPLIISNRMDGLAASEGYHVHMEASLDNRVTLLSRRL